MYYPHDYYIRRRSPWGMRILPVMACVFFAGVVIGVGRYSIARSERKFAKPEVELGLELRLEQANELLQNYSADGRITMPEQQRILSIYDDCGVYGPLPVMHNERKRLLGRNLRGIDLGRPDIERHLREEEEMCVVVEPSSLPEQKVLDTTVKILDVVAAVLEATSDND